LRYLVTGTAGFVGSHLTERLLAQGGEVIGVDAFLDNYSRERKLSQIDAVLEQPSFRLVEGLLQEMDLVELLEGVDQVFHLAAVPGVRPSWGKAFQDYADNNLLATQRLLEACREAGVQRLVYASSSSVYGDTAQLPMHEDALTLPFSPYGVTKLAAEHMVRLYYRNFDLETVSLRYFTVYGSRQRPDMAIQRFLLAAAEGGTVTVFGDGEHSRDFTHVADIVDATIRAAARGTPGRVYNVGGGSRVTVNELLALIEQVTGRRLSVERTPAKPGDVRATLADCSNAKQDLGFTPRVSLKEGLEQQWAWLNTLADKVGK
jgi:nucleoside-diphosphate-sugar epimerase